MKRIALVVSDVDGTLVTHDKLLTDRAKRAVQRLRDAGIGFTIVSSRPTAGMRFLIEPLGITLPVGSFNGSSIVDSQLKPIEQHLIPETAARHSLDLLDQFGIDIWLFTNDAWLTRNGDGEYVPHEKRAIRADPTIVGDFSRYVSSACKIVGASSDAELLRRCQTAIQQAVGAQATALQSQSYYLDITPPGQDKGTFVEAMAKRLGISTDTVATIGDMQNDLAMFKKSGLSIAMGNATDDVKQQASHVTSSNEEEGFAAAVEFILKQTPPSS
jgi:Cof subfamily protein (haloacid dehalogenase superfamily)